MTNKVKYRLDLQRIFPTEYFLTKNLLVTCNRTQGWGVRFQSETGKTEIEVKVPKNMLSVYEECLEPETVGR